MISKVLYQVAIALIIGALLPICTLIIPWQPEGEALATWFQRSGSILVVITVFCEFKLLKISSSVDPGESTITYGHNVGDLQLKCYRFLSSSVLFLAIVGTLIWGYGDIPLRKT
ncbi:MAG: hypothetical protein ACJAWI_002063 [Marinomonas primoryensis]